MFIATPNIGLKKLFFFFEKYNNKRGLRKKRERY